MLRPNCLLLAISVAALAALTTGCTAANPGAAATAPSPGAASSSPARTPPATISSPASPRATTIPPTSAVTVVATPSTSTIPPAVTPPATATPTRPETVVPVGLAGRWAVHDAVVDVRTDGTGVMSIHGCVPGIPACTVVSDLRVRPYFGGLILSVQHSYALDTAGRRVALPATFDAREAYQSPGDYSVIVPFTAQDWPYAVPATNALLAHVYNWQVVHAGGHPSATTDTSARIIRDLDHFPAQERESDFFGA
ncbi:hypothetical protein V3N99_11795 [Dermatophilaceae bacterium Soc4.6]